MIEEPIRVSIGSEPLQRIAADVLKSSIVRRTSYRVEFTESWTAGGGWSPLFKRKIPLKQGTQFSIWRWLVPELYGHAGRAIYLDADQVVLADIADLWQSLEAGKPFAAVLNAIGIFGKKRPELGHTQTSVMVMDCERCDWSYYRLARMVVGKRLRAFCLRRTGQHAKSDYAALMQAAWIRHKDITELHPSWNHFGIVQPDTRLVHWSHVASQPYRRPQHPTAGVFRDELTAGLKLGLIEPHVVREEIDCGHLDESYASTLEAC